MYERFLNKEVQVSYKFPVPTPDRGIAFPGATGKLVFADAEGIVLEDSAGIEQAIPHSSIQTVTVTTRIERASPGILIPNIRG